MKVRLAAMGGFLRGKKGNILSKTTGKVSKQLACIVLQN